MWQKSFSSVSERQWQADLESSEMAGAIRKKRMRAAMEDHLEKSASTKRWRLRLMEPEETEDILEACEEKRWAVFRDLRHKREKKDHFVASRRRWSEHQRERAALQESWQDDWRDIQG